MKGLFRSPSTGGHVPLSGTPSPLPLVPAGLPGGKGAMNAFLLPQDKLCSAKMLLAAYMPPLRITIRGKNPPDHPLCGVFIRYEQERMVNQKPKGLLIERSTNKKEEKP